MNLVKTYVKESPLHGLGLFAGEFIPKGTLIWKFVPPFDVMYPSFIEENIDPAIKNYLHTYVYTKNGISVLCGDDARYTNHSKLPNTFSPIGTEKQFALRDIEKDEEITCDYYEIDDTINESYFKH